MNFILALCLILIILKQINYIKNLVIITKKNRGELIVVIGCTLLLSGIIYWYAQTLLHYIIGILGITLFLTSWMAEGFTIHGFIRSGRVLYRLPWDQMTKIKISSSSNITVIISGDLINQKTCFNQKDSPKLMDLLEEQIKISEKIEAL